MKTIETKVYEFDELSDKAKETARDWLRECQQFDEWWESTYDDARNVHLKITSFDLSRHEIEGQFMQSAETTAKAIVSGDYEHGKDCETFKTATKFLTDLAAFHEKRIPYETAIENNEVYTMKEWDELEKGCSDDDLKELEGEFLKSILEDYRIILQAEYDYMNSDEQIDESIRANEYTFTEGGKRFG